MRVAVITASTPIYRGQEEDASGKVIRHILEEAGHDIVFQKALPCDKTVLFYSNAENGRWRTRRSDPYNRRSRMRSR